MISTAARRPNAAPQTSASSVMSPTRWPKTSSPRTSSVVALAGHQWVDHGDHHPDRGGQPRAAAHLRPRPRPRRRRRSPRPARPPARPGARTPRARARAPRSRATRHRARAACSGLRARPVDRDHAHPGLPPACTGSCHDAAAGRHRDGERVAQRLRVERAARPPATPSASTPVTMNEIPSSSPALVAATSPLPGPAVRRHAPARVEQVELRALVAEAGEDAALLRAAARAIAARAPSRRSDHSPTNMRSTWPRSPAPERPRSTR